MTELAWNKYNEADFFLGKLRETHDPEEYRYYLSAYLTATRSIVDYLGNEWSHKDRFRDWLEEKKDELYQNQFTHFMIESRNYVVHEGRPEDTKVEVRNVSSTAVELRANDESTGTGTIKIVDQAGDCEWSVSTTSTSLVQFVYPSATKDIPEVDRPFYFREDTIDVDFPESHAGTPVEEMCEDFLDEMKDILDDAETLIETLSDSCSSEAIEP